MSVVALRSILWPSEELLDVGRPRALFCRKPASTNDEDVRHAECFTELVDCQANGFHCFYVPMRPSPFQVGRP